MRRMENLVPYPGATQGCFVVRMLPGGPGFITDRARFSFDGLYRNRTAHVFSKSDAEEWSRASWSDFFLWMKDLAGTSTRGTVVVGPEVDLKTLAALKELSSTVDIKVTGVGSPYVPTESIDDLCSLGALGSAHPLSFEQDVLDRAERDGPDGGKALVIVLGANVMKENVLLHTQFKSAYQKDLADFVTVGTTLNDNQFPSTYMSYNDLRPQRRRETSPPPCQPSMATTSTCSTAESFGRRLAPWKRSARSQRCLALRLQSISGRARDTADKCTAAAPNFST